MTGMQLVVDAAIIFNFLCFIVAARALFRSDHARAPAYLFMAAFLALLVGDLFCLWVAPREDVRFLAPALLVLGASLALFGWAAQTIRKRPFTVIYSPDTPEFINTDGPYALVRHPFYTAYLLSFLAVALASAHVGAWAILAIIAAVYLHGARAEEQKFSQSPHAATYARYRQDTGMFFPRGLRGFRP